MTEVGSSRIRLLGLCALGAGLALGSQGTWAAAKLPTRQEAMVQTAVGGPDTLHLQHIAVPRPASGQVLIRIYAASINPVDWAGMHTAPEGGGAIERIPGMDVAGVIAAVGPDVTDRSVGTPVFALLDHEGLNGGYAEYALAKAVDTTRKPDNVGYVEAAGLGVVGVTALRALDDAEVHAGQHILITGVAGGVGSVAAQIAVARGAIVLGTASPQHTAYLRRLGVSKIIDYRHGDIAGQAGSVDAVIDTVGGSEAVEAFHALKPGGRFLSIARAKLTTAECDAAQVRCFGSPGRAAEASTAVMTHVAQLAHDGNLRIHVDRTFPLAKAAQALQYSHAGHVEGKVILVVRRSS